MTEFAIPEESVEKKRSGHKHGMTTGDEDRDGDGGFYYSKDDEYVSAHAVKCVKYRYMRAMEEDPDQDIDLSKGAKGIKGFENASCLIPGRHCPAVFMWEEIMETIIDRAPDHDWKNATQGMALKSVREVLQRASDNFNDLPDHSSYAHKTLESLPVTVNDLTVSEEEEMIVEKSAEEISEEEREMEA